ncbi:hypothetical protein VNO77_05691 [Canavalia gladiata]|uniref:Uncharacterized protein n=1 Tax=Canavalia gladiata TaxID=3824 RepID=A0AAN9R5W9_CANGL
MIYFILAYVLNQYSRFLHPDFNLIELPYSFSICILLCLDLFAYICYFFKLRWTINAITSESVATKTAALKCHILGLAEHRIRKKQFKFCPLILKIVKNAFFRGNGGGAIM